MAGYRHLEIVTDFERYVKDKKVSAKSYYRYMLTRLQRMFQYKNLPDTIPHEILDRYLFEYGIACITEVNGKLYVFSGNLGGPQDAYYRPTEFIISNPHIKVNGELFTANVPVYYTEDEASSSGEPWSTKGVLIRNDLDWIGLHPLLSRYAYLMAENILTLRTADVMLRVLAMITAPSDKERAAALEYLKSLEKGELAVIGDTPLVTEGVKLQSPPSNNGSYLTQFIEYQQYLKGSFYNEVGLSANYNMKREAIGTGESTLDSDSILPLCDNMLKCRQEDMAKVNEMFGTDIQVEFSSAWLRSRIEMLQSMNAGPGGVAGVLGQPSGVVAESLLSGGGSSDSGPSGDYSDNTEGTQEDVVRGEEQDRQDRQEDVGGQSEVNTADNNSGDDDSTGNSDSELPSDGGDLSDKEVDIQENTGALEEDTTSRINDLSQDKEMTETLEHIDDKPMPILVDQGDLGGEKNDGDNGDAGDEKGSADKGNDSEG